MFEPGLTREQKRELREITAGECLAEIADATPELDDERLGYVSLQIDRGTWLRARSCPRPPFMDDPVWYRDKDGKMLKACEVCGGQHNDEDHEEPWVTRNGSEVIRNDKGELIRYEPQHTSDPISRVKKE